MEIPVNCDPTIYDGPILGYSIDRVQVIYYDGVTLDLRKTSLSFIIYTNFPGF
jgi:hypothetical protein